MNVDESYMLRCLELARNGMSSVAPNPMVGSLLVHEGRIIGEGYHKAYGRAHAEVNAIASVRNPELIPLSTLYVNLEPCAHHGKTPPCVDLILTHRIKQVVIGCQDPFPKVAGQGIEKLRQHGCEVITGVLENASRQLNKRFMTFHEKRRPFIILKWAQTADGYIDVIRGTNAPAQPTWITNERLRMLVHKWRSEEMAIMAGTNTVLMDNPRLNVRHWHGRQPVRVIIDRHNKLPNTLHVFDNSQKTIIYNAQKDEETGSTSWIKIAFGDNTLSQIMSNLYEKNIQSVFVEGGRILLQSFIDHNLWDEARVFIGKKTFGHGIPAPRLSAVSTSQNDFWGDQLLTYHNPQPQP